MSVKEGLAGMFLIVLVESAKRTDHCFKMNGNAIQEKQRKYTAWLLHKRVNGAVKFIRKLRWSRGE